MAAPTTVTLVGGSRDGTTEQVEAPWPRKWITVSDGAGGRLKYEVRPGTTTADYVPPNTYVENVAQTTEGAAGPSGPAGPAGPAGGVGPKGDPGASWNHRDAWAAGTVYSKYDVVRHNGSGYVSLIDFNQGNIPGDPGTPAGRWGLVVLKGDTGATGATGPQGPQGETGATGAQGPAGPINTLLDEGVALPVRSKINFIGAAVTATDDAVNDAVNVNITGGGGGGGATYADMILADSPLAYWPLASDFQDAGPNAYHLTAQGGVAAGGAAGPFSGSTATAFDGVDDLLYNETAALTNRFLASTSGGAQDITLEAWVWLDQSAASSFKPFIGCTNEASRTQGYMLAVNSTNGQAGRGQNFSTLFESVAFHDWSDQVEGLVRYGRWAHLAITMNVGSSFAQVNQGWTRKIAASLTPQLSGINRVFIGGYNVAGRWHKGRIAHVAVYDRILSRSDLARRADWPRV